MPPDLDEPERDAGDRFTQDRRPADTLYERSADLGGHQDDDDQSQIVWHAQVFDVGDS
jgi:hypothetical protein